MALVQRRALLHVVFTFDCDTTDGDRLKDGVALVYAVGMWDTERPDPRPKDGFNKPKDAPDQMGFWAKGLQPSQDTVGLDLVNGELPAHFAEQLNETALRTVGTQAEEMRAMRAHVADLEQTIKNMEAELVEHGIALDHVRATAAQTVASVEAKVRELQERDPAIQLLRATVR